MDFLITDTGPTWLLVGPVAFSVFVWVKATLNRYRLTFNRLENEAKASRLALKSMPKEFQQTFIAEQKMQIDKIQNVGTNIETGGGEFSGDIVGGDQNKS